MSSSTSFTIIPPFLLAGLYDYIICKLLFEMFNVLKSISYIATFLAFIMLGNEAIFGIFSLRSQVITAGNFSLSVYNPLSISLVTFTLPYFTTILDAKVA
jgi:hypothetical protein